MGDKWFRGYRGSTKHAPGAPPSVTLGEVAFVKEHQPQMKANYSQEIVMGDVVEIEELTTTNNLAVEQVCDNAKDLDTVILVGLKDGKFQLRSSQTDMGEVALHLLAAQKLVAESL